MPKKREKEEIDNYTMYELNINKNNNEKDKNFWNTEFKEESFFQEFSLQIEKKYENKEVDENLEKFCFFFLSIFSAFAIIIINRGIFASFDNISSKKIFNLILVVYAGTFLFSLLFYFFYSIPKMNQKCKHKKKEKIENNSGNQKEREDEKNNNQEFNNIMNVQINANKNAINNIKNGEIKSKKETKYKELPNNEDSKLNTIKDDKRYNKNKIENIGEIKEDINNYNYDNKDFRKVCTCVGYIYFWKKIGKKNICICYKYNSCCSWFCSKIIKLEIFGPLIIEIYIQFNSVGYYSVLSDKLLEEYSFSKIIKFLAYLFSFILLYTIYVLILHSYYSTKLFLTGRNDSDSDNDKNNINNNSCIERCNMFTLFFYIIIFFALSISICILSILYICVDDHSGDKWDNRFQSGVILSKCLDLQMLSFFDFFDDEDCLNTSLFITIEKLIWMIIEVIFDIAELKYKSLFIFQISVSGLFFIFSVFALIFFYLDIKPLCKNYRIKKKNENIMNL